MAELQVGRGGHAVTSLNAVTATGAGTAATYDFCRNNFSLQTFTTGTPASVSCTLEGSLDGVHWVVLATSTSTTGDLQTAVDKPVRFVRANLGTLTGGTSPTVTAFIGAV